MNKRLLSLAMVLVLCLGFLPAAAVPAHAAGTMSNIRTDDFGITMPEMSDREKQEALQNSPTGTDTGEWVTLSEVNELFVASIDANDQRFYTYDFSPVRGNQVQQELALYDFINGKEIGSSQRGNRDNDKEGKGYRLYDSVACDPYGSGQKEYVLSSGFWYADSSDGRHIDLILQDGRNGERKFANNVSTNYNESLDQLKEANPYQPTGFMSVAAGDFDGDGKDTALVYIPEMGERDPHIDEYTIGKDSFHFARTVISGSTLWDLLGTGDLSERSSKNQKVRNDTPLVQMVAADTDKDGVDELLVTTSMNNCSANNVTERQSRLFIYDLHHDYRTSGSSIEYLDSWTWKKTADFSFNGYTGGVPNAQRLRWASSSVGNLIHTDGVDYPEIVTAGWVDKESGASTNVDQHYIGSFVTTCTGTERTPGADVGTYETAPYSAVETSGFTQGGYQNNDDMKPLVQVSIFSAEGPQLPAYVLIDDTVYQTGGAGWQKVFRHKWFDKERGVGSDGTTVVSNGAVIDAVAGNFDGSVDGAQQVMFAALQKNESQNDYYINIFAYVKEPEKDWELRCCNQLTKEEWVPGTNANPFTHSERFVNGRRDVAFALAAPDVDNDSIIGRLVDVDRFYTEPSLLGLLEASPYFEEVAQGNIGNSETAYGTSYGSSSSVTTSTGLSTNLVTGFEWSVDDICAGFVCGAGVEASLESSTTWETTEETSIEYSLDFSNNTTENQALVYRRPVTSFKYELKNDQGSYMIINREGTLNINMISVDRYNQLAEANGLPPVPEGMLATPGNPASYRKNIAGHDCLTSGHSAPYSSPGVIGQTITVGKAQESAVTYEQNSAFTAYGLAFGAKFGGGAGSTVGSTTTKVNTSSISKSGVVEGAGSEKYDFQWQFATWKETLKHLDADGHEIEEEIPVMGYLVNNVQAIPRYPQLSISAVGEHDMTLSWDEPNGADPEQGLYELYRVDTLGRLHKEAELPYGTHAYTVEELQPNTAYTFCIRAVHPNADKEILKYSEMSPQVQATTYNDNYRFEIQR